MRISDNKGNVTNFGIINNTIQNNVELTLEQKMEIKTSFKEFIKAIFGKLTYKFIGNYKLEKVLFEKYIINCLDKIKYIFVLIGKKILKTFSKCLDKTNKV